MNKETYGMLWAEEFMPGDVLLSDDQAYTVVGVDATVYAGLHMFCNGELYRYSQFNWHNIICNGCGVRFIKKVRRTKKKRVIRDKNT
jgi:hypothetical protein